MSEFTAAPIGCLIMAAGNASRFGENKLTAIFAGKSLFSLALAAIPADTFARVTVVSQYPALLQEAEQAGFHAIRNDRPDDGISRTIRLGTASARGHCAAPRRLLASKSRLHHKRGAQWSPRQSVPVPGAVFPGAVRARGRPRRLVRHPAARGRAAARRGRGARAVRLRHKAGAGDPEGKRIAPLIPGAAGGAWRDR